LTPLLLTDVYFTILAEIIKPYTKHVQAEQNEKYAYNTYKKLDLDRDENEILLEIALTFLFI